MTKPFKISIFGFSLIELMIVVVIIGVLAAIAIPQYGSYVRKSRTAEASANINSIAQYEEQYYSENNHYMKAGGNPVRVPTTSDTGGVLSFNTTDPEWVELGAVFTNNTQLRFQYRAFAGQFNSTGGSVSASYYVSYTTNFALSGVSTGTSKTCTDTASIPASITASYFGVTQTNYANWFVITAMGNQVDDATSNQKCSLFAKVNDRPAVYSINDTD